MGWGNGLVLKGEWGKGEEAEVVEVVVETDAVSQADESSSVDHGEESEMSGMIDVGSSDAEGRG